MNGQEHIQALTLVMSLIGVFCWIRKARLGRRTVWEIVPVLSLLIHIAAFYISILLILPPGPGTNYGGWSSIISLHTVIILIALAWQRGGIVLWKIG